MKKFIALVIIYGLSLIVLTKSAYCQYDEKSLPKLRKGASFKTSKKPQMYNFVLINGKILKGSIAKEDEKGYTIQFSGGNDTKYFDFSSELYVKKDKISRVEPITE
ncbi:MAG: hypothetical protein NTW09_05550 [Candidatus Omnitrophica bacterium]|nr:hypothetical protein [Candidatus Omnitrophota bacterium]